MTRPKLLLAAAAAALAAAPLAARPMTATDMHMMHRLGAPEVSADGKWAVFTISDTDLDKNKRNNTLYLLDLTKPGAAPQPIAAAAKGHDAVFGPDGALWFLMAADGRDQLFRMPIGGAAAKVSDFPVDVGGFKLSPAGDRVVVWADRPDCSDIACSTAQFPAKPAGCRANLRPIVRSPLGYVGRAGNALASVRLPDSKRTSDRRRGPSDRPDLRATRRPSRSAAARS